MYNKVKMAMLISSFAKGGRCNLKGKMMRTTALESDIHVDKLEHVVRQVEQVIVGKRHAIKLILMALLANGHVLLEDVPGVGKTMLVRALAKTLGCDFKRIQFTPDLLPTDITGVSVFNQQSMQFEFKPGPVMGNLILADEINRTTPKTQSALLEAMEESSVTVDGVTYRMKQPFMVLATQNPIEYGGTYALPEAQLDRFLMKVRLGYPTAEEEMVILQKAADNQPIGGLQPLMDREEIIRAQQEVQQVHVDMKVKQYVIAIAQATRHHDDVMLGVSPRGSIAVMRAAQAKAYLEGRDYVLPDDVKSLIDVTLGHRLLLSAKGRMAGRTSADVLRSIVAEVSVSGIEG
jgi:MoxR-like ATPase